MFFAGVLYAQEQGVRRPPAGSGPISAGSVVLDAAAVPDAPTARSATSSPSARRVPVRRPSAQKSPKPRPPAKTRPTKKRSPKPKPAASRRPAKVIAPQLLDPPVRVAIPVLGIDRGLIDLKVTATRELEVPKDYADIGWWRTGPSPGEHGAAVLVGHVDNQRGPAVFAALGSLKKGARVSVVRKNGEVATFEVTGMHRFPKDDFPDDLVYRTSGKRSLHLVTCGGIFDEATGHYLDNIVVFADLVDDTERARA